VSIERALVPPAGVPSAGELVADKYEVEHVLGSGGMGVVVAARHVQLGRRVAIKFLRGYAADDPNATERFLREARAAVVLTSQHATKVLDVGTTQAGEPYIVMEYLAGMDLTELLRQRGRLGVEDTVDIVLQACEAIAEAHAHGIVHRDLKPPNLFVTTDSDGRRLIKVLDFGISKSVGDQANPNLTASGSLVGSPAYMSPEQVRAPKSVDTRTDVWALGVILYELLTGKSPFSADTLGETLARIVTETPLSIRELRADVPEGLDTVVRRCLRREPERRVQSVAELASMLQPFAAPESEALVRRIQRIGSSAPYEAAPVAERASPAQRTYTSDASAPAALRERTATQWQTSGASHEPASRRRGRWVAVGAGAFLLVAAVGVFALRGRRGDGSKASDQAEAQPGTSKAPRVPSPATASATPGAGAPLPSPDNGVSAAPELPTEALDAGRIGTLPVLHAPPMPRRRAPAPPPAQSSTTNEKDIF
jgi:serine/threonine-protein kinase